MRVGPGDVFSLLQSKVARRILAMFVLCALLPVCVLGGLSLWQVSRKLQNETYQAVRHASKNAAMSLLDALSVVSSDIITIADSQALQGKGEWPKRASRSVYDQARLTALTFYDEEGRYNVLFGEPCPRPALSDRQRNHLASGKALIFFEKERSAPRIFIAIRTTTRGSVTGLLVGEASQAYLWQATLRAIPAEMEASVLLKSKHILFSSLPFSQTMLIGEDANLFTKYSGQLQWSGQKETYLSGYWTANLGVPYLTENWVVMASQPLSTALSSLQRFTRLFLLVLLLMLLIVLLLSLVQIRKNLIPLARLKEGTQRVALGDLESPVKVQSGDEFEELANAFNSMSGHLKKQFDNLNQMGRMVRTILTSLDRTSIVESALNDIRTVVPSDCAVLLLLKANGKGKADAYYIDNTGQASARRFQFSCMLSEQQIMMLERTVDNITEGLEGSFSSITAPLAERGARSFAVIPIRSSHRVIGSLTLAYRAEPSGFSEDLARGRQLADHIAAAISNADLLNDLADLNVGTLTALARAVDANSHWTAGHSERVTALSLNMGQAMGLSRKELDILHRAGLLHDLGKIGVPGFILDKPDKLTDEEWTIIKEHPAKGALILEPIPAFNEVVPLVAQHHERFDGNGYPLRLAGTDISPGARILAVADVYDALISDRPYRPGWRLNEVIQYINSKAGLDFDPEVVLAFRSLKADEHGADSSEAEQHSGNVLRVANWGRTRS
jgi:putative nucleotidyltransferase with HDIG domain